MEVQESFLDPRSPSYDPDYKPTQSQLDRWKSKADPEYADLFESEIKPIEMKKAV